MATEFLGVAGSYLLELGLDASRDRLKDATMEYEARRHLGAYLERQGKINEICSEEEELDFQGIIDYIRNDLIKDVKLRLFGAKQERAIARDSIQSKAALYAQAHTKLSKERTQKMVDDSMSILRSYYRGKTNRELRFIATEIEDEVEDTVNYALAAHGKKSAERFEQLEKKIESNSAFSLDHNVALAKQGNIAEVQENLTTEINNEYRQGWKSFNVELELTADNRKKIFEKANTEIGIWLNQNVITDIFGTTIHFCIQRFFPCAMIVSLDRLKEKARVLDDGDKLKMTFVPGSSLDDTRYIDHIVDEADFILYTAEIDVS